MKKLLKSLIAVALCFMVITSVPASAVTTSFAPYSGYEYDSHSESVAAPIGYLASRTVSGHDLNFEADVKQFTDICLDSHSPDYMSFFILDGKAGNVYKTDTSLDVKSIFDKFTDTKGRAVSLVGATKIACDYSNSFFFVYKSGKIYVISSLSKVTKTINVSGLVAMTSVAVPSGDSFSTVLLTVTSDKANGVTAYDINGNRLGFYTLGGNINAMTFSFDNSALFAVNASKKKILKADVVTDFDDEGNDVFSGINVSEEVDVSINMSAVKSIAVDSMGDKIYLALPSKVAQIGSFDGTVCYIDSSSLPHNRKVSSMNYSALAVATDDNDTLVALTSDGKSQAAKYNSLLGFIGTSDKLSISLKAPKDMLYKSGKYIYILDSGNSRILKLDKDLKQVLDIYADFYSKKVGYLSFYGAEGFTIDDNENIYVADTNNYRVFKSDAQGNVKLIINRPDQQLSDTDAPFRATKVMLDRKNRIFVLCDSINLGAFVFDQSGDFQSFFGSNTVQATVDVILNAIRKRFLTHEQLKGLQKVTPIALTNFDIDNDGFIYTVTKTDNNSRNTKFSGMIRKLNFQGDNVFTLSGNSIGFGDFEWDRSSTMTNTSFCDVDVDDSGYINLIDSGRGKVFQYSTDGDLITVFGGFSNQVGTFNDPVAVESVGESIYVLDSTDGAITIFNPTDYTNALRKAYDLFDSSDSDAALAAWSTVLKFNTNSQYPYYGMGMAYEMKGDYEQAMHYFKLANARGSYSKAYQEFRKDYVNKNIWWMALIVIAVVVGIVFLSKFLKKKMVAKHGSAYSPLETKWGLPIYVLLHPVDGFEQFRTRNMQSVPIALGLSVCWFLVNVVEYFCTGFAFNNNRAVDYDAFANIIGTIGLYVLFVISNWALCTLLNGKGRTREIICVVGYSLTPILITKLLAVLLTNVMTLQESAFVSIITTLGMLWAAIILLLGLYTIHQYSFGATVLSTIFTVVGMFVIALLVVLFFTLLQQCFSFFYSVYSELKLR